MCGIVGYIGNRKVVPILLKGLKSLEYRGYDSAGIVYLVDGVPVKHRCQGKLAFLEELVEEHLSVDSNIGLGHTRWATHGAPTTSNAHPHSDCSGDLVVVHNGIIENYHSLRQDLIEKGHTFTSETDTEVLAHLIEENLDDDLAAAVKKSLTQVVGSYAIGVVWSGRPDILVAARNQSPLVLGIQNGNGCLMASDIPALLPYTKEVVFLEDAEMAILNRQGAQIFSLASGEAITRAPVTIQWNAAMAEKGGYKHYMLKEIFEQPHAVRDTLGGRINPETGQVDLPDLALNDNEINDLQRIVLVACGTSWHAALVAKYWLEKWTDLAIEVDIASEFRYRDLHLNSKTLVIAISQSGETADTLAGIRKAALLGARIVTICNVIGSTMTREADGTIYTHAGPEIGVASTKAFTAQLTALILLAIYLGQVRRSIAADEQLRLAGGLMDLPGIIAEELQVLQPAIRQLTEKFYHSRDFLFVGRGINFPIALEGALKLKEISYIHAEGYAAGELKHGPIALVDKDMPIMALTPRDSIYEKTISNVEEIKARRGKLLLIGTRGDNHLTDITDDVLYLPAIEEELNPILYTLPAQLLAYEIAARRGCDVDQPRNLAKSVTVE